MSLGSADEALESTLAALELDPEPAERAHLHESAARAARMAGQSELAEQMAALAVDEYQALGLDANVPGALRERASAYSSLGRLAEGRVCAELGDTLASARDDVPAEVRLGLLRELGWSVRVNGDREASARYTFRGMRIAEAAGDPAMMVEALNSLSTVLVDEGSFTASRAVLQHCITTAREQRLVDPLSRGLTNLLANTVARDATLAAELTEECVSVTKQVGERYALDIAVGNACYTWLLSGRWDRLVAEASELLDDRAATAASNCVRWARAMVAAARGEAVEQSELVPSDDTTAHHMGELVAALRLATSGDPAKAAADAFESATRAYASEGVLEDIDVWWPIAVELQIAVGDVDAAAELMSLSEPRVVAEGSALGHGELPRLRGLLALARGEDPEAELRAAEIALEAFGAPYLLARTRLELGRWLHAAGRIDEAMDLLGLARPAFELVGAEPSLAEIDAIVLASTPSPPAMVIR